MKKHILTVLCAVLLFGLGFQTGRITAPKQDSVTENNADSEVPEYDEPDDFEAYISNRYEGLPIAGNNAFSATDYNGNTLALDSLGTDGTVFMRYSTSGCHNCIDAMLAALKKYAAANADSRVVLLIRGIAMRDMYVMSAELGPQFRLLLAEKLPIDFNGAETPVAFQIADGKIKNHFTARYGDEARTDTYVKSIISPK